MIRLVPIDDEQYRFIEQLGMELMREDDHESATRLLAIALSWRAAAEVPPVGPNFYACNVDESAGMAEVVDLHDFSKKVS